MLLFALEKQPIQQQQDYGADDRHDPARWLSRLVPADGLAEVSGNERAPEKATRMPQRLVRSDPSSRIIVAFSVTCCSPYSRH